MACRVGSQNAHSDIAMHANPYRNRDLVWQYDSWDSVDNSKSFQSCDVTVSPMGYFYLYLLTSLCRSMCVCVFIHKVYIYIYIYMCMFMSGKAEWNIINSNRHWGRKWQITALTLFLHLRNLSDVSCVSISPSTAHMQTEALIYFHS